VSRLRGLGLRKQTGSAARSHRFDRRTIEKLFTGAPGMITHVMESVRVDIRPNSR